MTQHRMFEDLIVHGPCDGIIFWQLTPLGHGSPWQRLEIRYELECLV
jgi:hypothetical protein